MIPLVTVHLSIKRRIGFLSLAFIGLVAVLFAIGPRNTAPSLIISFSHYERRLDGHYAFVELKNVGSATVCYYGYRADSPIYQVQVKADEVWRNAPRFWCGNGIEPAWLSPGESKMVRVSLPTNQTWKVGITFRKVRLEDRLPGFVARWLPSFVDEDAQVYTAWSPPVPYYAKVQ